MAKTFRRTMSLLLVPLLMLPLLLQAATPQFEEGKHYRVLRAPVQTATSKKEIEVAEAFWYGCPHCYSLEAVVNPWKQSLADDVKFVPVPAFFGPNIWKDHAKIYYTLETLYRDEKERQRAHAAVFTEIQERQKRLNTADLLAEFLNTRFKADKTKVTKIYNSFGVNNRLSQSFSKVRGYRLTGVPALVVDGRYVIEPKVGLQNMPVVADFLVKKVRDERAAQAKGK